MNSYDTEMVQFVIEQFMGCKVNLNNWNGIMSVIRKVEEQTNNRLPSGTQLKTHLDRLDNNEHNMPQHRFSIIFNSSAKYSETGSNKEYATIMALSYFCKDWIISNQMDKALKTSKNKK